MVCTNRYDFDLPEAKILITDYKFSEVSASFYIKVI